MPNAPHTPIATAAASATALLPGSQPLLSDDNFWRQHEERLAQREAEETRHREAWRQLKRQKRWQEIPETYRQHFYPSQCALSSEVIANVQAWTPDTARGLGLIGGSGLGKTRLLVRGILHRLQCSWLFLPSTRFATALREQYSEDWGRAKAAHEQILTAHSARVLLLDDIGQETLTPRVAEALFDLIEHRTSRNLPILWTSNTTTADLEQRDKSHSPAIVRRLREFTTILLESASPTSTTHNYPTRLAPAGHPPESPNPSPTHRATPRQEPAHHPTAASHPYPARQLPASLHHQ